MKDYMCAMTQVIKHPDIYKTEMAIINPLNRLPDRVKITKKLPYCEKIRLYDTCDTHKLLKNQTTYNKSNMTVITAPNGDVVILDKDGQTISKQKIYNLADFIKYMRIRMKFLHN